MTHIWDMLRRAETKARLVHDLVSRIRDEHELWKMKSPEGAAIEAAVDHGISQALDLIGPKVSDWTLNSETFYDAYMMLLQDAHKHVVKMLSDTETEKTFDSMRPEMVIDVRYDDRSEEIPDRQPTMLRERYAEALQMNGSKSSEADTSDFVHNKRPTKKARKPWTNDDLADL